MLWAVDRNTFRHIIITATAQRRALYELFLGSVSLFSELPALALMLKLAALTLLPLSGNLTDGERSLIADCLESEQFMDGDVIIKIGDPGDKFYIIEQVCFGCCCGPWRSHLLFRASARPRRLLQTARRWRWA